MARYKHYDYTQMKMLPISFDRQILPGTFEHTLNYLIDEKIDLSVFEARYRNDDGGAPAYDPAILLKIILFAYSKGIIYSRRIEQLCRENVVCMALSADTVPHFTTIAAFVSSLSAEITTIFRNVLLVCDEAGLIGKEMFAIDGVKLPSGVCSVRSKCLRHPERSPYRQVVFFRGTVPTKPETYLDKMKRKIDSAVGRYEYGRRLGLIEPVFGNIRGTKRLTRFTLRGRRKVDAQWQMYCLVHNIDKIQRYGRLEKRMRSTRRRAA